VSRIGSGGPQPAATVLSFAFGSMAAFANAVNEAFGD
jgi:hypothetical protein